MFWPALVVLIALIALAVAAANSGSSSPLYAEDLRSQAAVVARKAVVFQETLARIGSVDRVELVNVIDEVEAAIDDAQRFLASIEDPPEGAAAAGVLFGLALDLWEQGAVDLEAALLTAADDSTAVLSDDLAVNALLDLRAGDRLYVEAVEQLSVGGATPPVSPMPTISFLPNGYPIIAGATTLLSTAKLDGSPLELRAELQITNFTTEPAWVVDTEGAVTIEHTETLSFKVVVSNDGNTRSEPSEVLLEIVGGGIGSQSFVEPVEALEPGVSTTVVFVDVPVQSSITYQAAARLPLAEGELETDDNARSQRFTVNAPTPSTTTTTQAESGGDS